MSFVTMSPGAVCLDGHVPDARNSSLHRTSKHWANRLSASNRPGCDLSSCMLPLNRHMDEKWTRSLCLRWSMEDVNPQLYKLRFNRSFWVYHG